MARLLGRKLLLMLLLLPVLNAVGFYYAVTFAPAVITNEFNFVVSEHVSTAFWPAYQTYLQNMMEGDWGAIQRTPLRSFLLRPLMNTLWLLLIGVGVTVVLGPLVGVLAVSPRTGRIGRRAQLVLTVGSAVPGFFLGSLLIVALIYLARADWYPGRGTPIPVQGFGIDAHLILPVLTLAARPVLYIASVTAGLLENELQQEYVRVARSKGLGWGRLLWRHAFPNIVAPVTVTIGQSLRLLISGLILAEALFDWRGLGRLFLLVVAIESRGRTTEYFLKPELLALILVFFGLVLLLADLIASVIAHLADPRLRQVDERPAHA